MFRRSGGRRRWTASVACLAAVAVMSALLSLAPASSTIAPAAVETATKKPPKCTAGQVGVILKGRARCRKLGAVPAGGDQRLALFRSAIRQDFSDLRTSAGKPVPSLVRAANRSKHARARMLAVLPRALEWADSHLRREAALSHATPPCGAFAGSDSAKIGDFTISLSRGGDLSVSGNLNDGYRIEVFLGKAVPGCALDLSQCPTAEGVLEGRDSHTNTIMTKVTQNGQLVNSVSIVVRSTQTMRGQAADDAKLETLDLQDTSRETTSVAVPGERLRMLLTVRRATVVDMRSGQPRSGSTTVNAQLQIIGDTQTFRAGTDPAVVRRYTEDFKEIISEEVGNYRSRETAWQSPGTCAKLTFDPASGGSTKLKLGENGAVTGKVESNQGGVAAKGKWKVTGQANGVFTPPTAEGGTAPFQYVVTRVGSGVRLSGSFRTTSTAGVAEGTWSQPTEADEDAYFKILGVTYNANHTGTWSGSGLPCFGDASGQESLSSGAIPFDPDSTRLRFGAGIYGGSIGTGPVPLQAPRSGIIHGCDLTSGTPVPCTISIDVSNPVHIGVIVEIQPNATTAKVTWTLPVVDVNDDDPPAPCYRAPPLAVPDPEVRTEPASTFLSPGTHTVSVTRNVSITAGPPTVTQSISGVTNASITFMRVHADGSPYTG